MRGSLLVKAVILVLTLQGTAGLVAVALAIALGYEREFWVWAYSISTSVVALVCARLLWRRRPTAAPVFLAWAVITSGPAIYVLGASFRVAWLPGLGLAVALLYFVYRAIRADSPSRG
jgi:hypothetical protein